MLVKEDQQKKRAEPEGVKYHKSSPGWEWSGGQCYVIGEALLFKEFQ